MPATPHLEQYFCPTEAGRDLAIGMSDGLTVRLPFCDCIINPRKVYFPRIKIIVG
jgi:hypothetical protein